MTSNIEITRAPDLAFLHRLHAEAFDRAWSAQEFQDLLGNSGCLALVAESGFALARLVAGEAELLTIVTSAQARRQGTGLALMKALVAWLAQQGAESLFLEVNVHNQPAIKLYEKLGFSLISRRKDYYTRKDGRQEDGLLYKLAL